MIVARRRRKGILSAPLSILILFPMLMSLPRASQSQAQGQAAPPSGKSGAATVMLTITVTDGKGHYFDGLPRSAFNVSENKSPLEITSFHNDDVPLSIGVLFDDSGSMSRIGKERLAVVKEALANFARQGHPANEYFLMSFNNGSQLLTDWTSGDKGFIDALGKLPASDKNIKGTTAFNDACMLALEKLATRPTARHALVVISDGLDNTSQHSFKELREALRRSDAILYAVSISNPEIASVLLYESQAILNDLTARTGGMALFPFKPEELRVALDVIRLELRHQYSVGVKAPASSEPGKWHSLKVKVAPLQRTGGSDIKLSGRSREGYYAP